MSLSCSVQFSHSVMSNSLWPHGLQHTRPPCPTSTLRVYPKSCPLSQWCHSTISSSVVPFSSNLSQHQGLFKWVCSLHRWPKYWGFSFNISPSNEHPGLISLGWTGCIPLQSTGLSRVFSNTTVQKHQFFGAQPSSQPSSLIPSTRTHPHGLIISSVLFQIPSHWGLGFVLWILDPRYCIKVYYVVKLINTIFFFKW